MKRTFVTTAGKKFITAAAIAALLSVGALNANASETTNEASHIEYIGTANNNENVAFNVNYENATGANFTLTVTNAAGEIIFSQNYSGKNFSKKVMINGLPEDGGKVTFAIKGADANLKESFNINTSTTVTSDVVVTKA